MTVMLPGNNHEITLIVYNLLSEHDNRAVDYEGFYFARKGADALSDNLTEYHKVAIWLNDDRGIIRVQ